MKSLKEEFLEFKISKKNTRNKNWSYIFREISTLQKKLNIPEIYHWEVFKIFYDLFFGIDGQRKLHKKCYLDLYLFIHNQKVLTKDEFLKFLQIILLEIYKKILNQKRVKINGIVYLDMENFSSYDMTESLIDRNIKIRKYLRIFAKYLHHDKKMKRMHKILLYRIFKLLLLDRNLTLSEIYTILHNDLNLNIKA